MSDEPFMCMSCGKYMVAEGSFCPGCGWCRPLGERKTMTLKLPTIRPLLYTDTIDGKQVCRDDMWVLTTEELNAADAELTSLRALLEELENSCAEKDAELSKFRQAIGLMTTIKGSMVMRPDDPIGMAQEVAAYVAALEKVEEYAEHRNDAGCFCESLKHSDFSCTCGLDAALTARKEGP